MGRDYIPEQDFYADHWLRNFAGHLLADPAGYRTILADAEEAVAAAEAFRVALRATETPGVQSRSFILAKNQARKFAEGVMRSIAQRIKRDPRIDSTLKVRIGLSPPGSRRDQSPVPQTRPLLYLYCDMSGILTVRVVDSGSFRRRRPEEAMGLELYLRVRPRDVVDRPQPAAPVQTDEAEASTVNRVPQVAGTPETCAAPAPAGHRSDGYIRPVAPKDDADTEPWQFIGVYSSWPIRLQPPVKATGDEVSLVARWINRVGKPGPMGRAVSMRVNHNSAAGLGNRGRDGVRLVA